MYTAKFKIGDLVVLSNPNRRFRVVAHTQQQIVDAVGDKRPTQDYLLVDEGFEDKRYFETDEEILELAKV